MSAQLAAGRGAVDAPTLDRVMSGREIHDALRERMIGLPQLNALILFGRDGHVINTTRSWPPPDVNISDTDYFRSIMGESGANMLITAPFRYKTDATWTVFLIHKMRGRDGGAAGLLVAAVELRYFEAFYRSVSVGDEGSITLLRGDGVQLARYPPAPTTGRNFMTVQPDSRR